MRLLRSFVLVSLLFVPFAARSQQTPSQQAPPQRDSNAISILARSYGVMGGNSLAAIQDTVATLRVTTFTNGSSSVSPASIRTMGRDKFRIDLQSADGPSTFVVNGLQASHKLGAGQAQALSARLNFEAGIVHLPVLSMLADWALPDMRLEYIGLEAVGATSLHHIRITRPSPVPDLKELESPCDVYINPQTLLVAKLVYLIRQPSNLRRSEPIEVSYADYRATSGLMVPFHITYSVRKNIVSDYQLTSFAVNRGTLQADFNLR